jgi:hypothetical protein
VVVLTAAVLLVCASAACGPVASGDEQQGRIHATYDDAGRLTRLAYDSDRNGQPDMWAYMDGARLVRLEADENEDGRIDRWEHYPAASGPGGLKQPPERIERSTRHDGRVSRREFFEAGLLVRVEEDTSGDGAVDKWESYSAGSLSRLELDTHARGKPDRRLIYRPDGSLERIEEDPTGSGEFRAVK